MNQFAEFYTFVNDDTSKYLVKNREIWRGVSRERAGSKKLCKM